MKKILQLICRKFGHKQNWDYQPFALEKMCSRCGEFYDDFEPMRFRKKPVVVEAIQWKGYQVNEEEVRKFVGKGRKMYVYGSHYEKLSIPTLEGRHEASIGDWIIKGVKGEFYPCKPDIFEKTYEKV